MYSMNSFHLLFEYKASLYTKQEGFVNMTHIWKINPTLKSPKMYWWITQWTYLKDLMSNELWRQQQNILEIKMYWANPPEIEKGSTYVALEYIRLCSVPCAKTNEFCSNSFTSLWTCCSVSAGADFQSESSLYWLALQWRTVQQS